MEAQDFKRIRKQLGLTQEGIAGKLGLDRRTIINYEKGNTIPGSIVKLMHVFESEINSHNGEKVKLDAGDIKVNQPLEIFNTKAGSNYEELSSGKYLLTVPLVPVRAQATYVSEHTHPEFLEELEKVSFIVDRVGKGKYQAFEIQNDSMDDGTIHSIPDGAIVLARELGRQHWKSKFRTNQYPFWIIVHKSTILCKEIVNHDVDNGIITCHSLNESPEYSDFDLKLNDVYQLFNVIKKTF